MKFKDYIQSLIDGTVSDSRDILDHVDGMTLEDIIEYLQPHSKEKLIKLIILLAYSAGFTYGTENTKKFFRGMKRRDRGWS